MDKVTIIVGVYNGEKYLKECIESIINQTYKNLEIILVDDESTDNSKAIIEKFKKNDKRIKLICQKNSGVSVSRNNAIKKSTGDYICIVDQDDILENDYIEYFHNLIINNSVEIATTPQPDKFFEKINPSANNNKCDVITGRDAVVEMLYHKFVIAPWNKMISAKLIKDNGILFNPDFYGGEGFAFSIECFQQASKVALGYRKVYHYRVGDPNTGASKYNESTILSSINAQKYIKDRLLFYNDDAVNKAWEFSNWHSYCDCFNMIIGCGAQNKNPKLYKEIYDYCKYNGYRVFKAPISNQQKLRGFLFRINPILAANVINKFRIRKFKKED